MRTSPSRHRSRRIAPLAVMAVAASLVLGALVSPAMAQDGDRADRPRIVVTGRVELRPEERSKTVIIFDGPAVIAGDVDGAVVAFNGDIRVSGSVNDNVVALKGRAIIEAGATVDGDVMSSDRPLVAQGATVGGETRKVNFANAFQAAGWVLLIAWWVAVSVSTFVLGLLLLLLAPRATHGALAVARSAVGPAIGWGLAMAVGLPIVSFLVLFTLVGIPLGLIGLLSMALLYGLGYVVAALFLGRRLVAEPRSVYLAFFVGWIILRVLDLVPVLGNLVTTAATVYGLGALTVAAWRAAPGRPVTAEPERVPA